MKYLFAGTMKDDEYNQLIKMSGQTSGPMIDAMRNHLVKGYSASVAVVGTEMLQGNMSRDLKKLESLYADIQKYNEIVGVKRINLYQLSDIN